MNKRTLFGLLAACFLLTASPAGAQDHKPLSLSSPGKTTRLEVGVDGQGDLRYRLFYDREKVVDWSPLGLEGEKVAGPTVIQSSSTATRNEDFAWPLGERDQVENHYRELKLACRSASLRFDLEARVYDGSVAFRYAVPEQAGLAGSTIRKEKTAFHFTGSYTLYQYHHESVFSPVSIDTFQTPCDFPATLAGKRLYLSIGEAQNTGYTKAELKRGAAAHSLAVAFVRDSAVKVTGAFQTPWRTLSCARMAIGLHRYSDLFLRLNPPPAGAMPETVRPGKLIRAQLTTEAGLKCIDFAAAHNFRYMMYDAGWYGAEFRTSSDPTQAIPAIDLPRVIAYGREKGVGVILYVNYVGLRQKLDTILPLYRRWGVAGMKFGFVDGFTQAGLAWLAGAIKKVNDWGFVLNIHDNYKPTGLSRTFPALLTQEGIRGDENSPDAFHTTVLPFTRYLAGPADFTYCYPNAKNRFSKNLKVSMGQQLALTVVYFSPLQSMFWYGRPEEYTNEEEIEFFKKVPTVWNESHYLAGEIGKNIAVARRSGAAWFVGAAAGPQDWRGRLRLHFLEKGRSYTATVFEDDETGRSIRRRTLTVRKDDAFSLDLKAATGQALLIEPVAEKPYSLR